MHKLIITFLLCFSILSGQENPKKISIYSKLEQTCKIWGFLKYYHPKVAKYGSDWDNELFKKLPEIAETKSEQEFHLLLLNWIEGLGPVSATNLKEKSTDENLRFDKNLNLQWIQNIHQRHKELGAKLNSIKENRFLGKRFFVESDRADQVKIINEKNIKSSYWTSEKHRLLVLFRYWNIIEYFFPYKYQMDISWDKTLSDMLPKFINAKTELDFHLAIKELVIRLDDSHAGFSSDILRKHFGEYHTPYLHKFIDKEYVVTNYYNDSLAKVNGLKIGDIIQKVNGEKPWDIFQRRLKYINGSNLARKKLASWVMISSGNTTSVELEVLRNGKKITKNVSRYISKEMGYNPKPKKLPKMDEYIAYMYLKEINNKRLNSLKDGIEKKKAWILDLRTYPKSFSGRTFMNVLSKQEKQFYKVIKPELTYPGMFREVEARIAGRNTGKKYNGHVFLLVNEQTQSMAEFQAMAIQTGEKVVTIGSQTSGADGNVSRLEIYRRVKNCF